MGQWHASSYKGVRFREHPTRKYTDIYLVKELLGHSDLKLTARYAHVGQNSLRAAVQRMAAQPTAIPLNSSNFAANLSERSTVDSGKTKAGGRS